MSLNASTPEAYDALCHSKYGLEALPAILKFTKEVVRQVPHVRMTAVDTMSAEELENAAICVRKQEPPLKFAIMKKTGRKAEDSRRFFSMF